MNEDQRPSLRRMLEEIDIKLLSILTGPRPLAPSALAKATLLKAARQVVLRLLNVADMAALGRVEGEGEGEGAARRDCR